MPPAFTVGHWLSVPLVYTYSVPPLLTVELEGGAAGDETSSVCRQTLVLNAVP